MAQHNTTKAEQVGQKQRDVYPLNNWLNDVLTNAQDVPSKEYANKVNLIKQEQNLDKIALKEDLLVRKLDKLVNKNKEGWKSELRNHDQILVLTSKVEVQAKRIEELKRNHSTLDQHIIQQDGRPIFKVKS